MMEKETKSTIFWVSFLIALVLLIVYWLIPTFNADFVERKEPECYISYDSKCSLNYDEIDKGARLDRGAFIQCCRKPHYLLQGMHEKLINDIVEIATDFDNRDLIKCK